jgi:hypothetical protein
MAGLGPAIHVFCCRAVFKTWMPATSAGMTMKFHVIPLRRGVRARANDATGRGRAIIGLRRHFRRLPYRFVSIDDFCGSYRNRLDNGKFVMAINSI